MISGDLNALTETMLSLATLRNSDVTEELTSEEMKSMMNAISNVLEEMNAGSWEELRREEPNRAVDVMFVVDAYVAVFARQQPVNTSTSLSMPMLLVELDWLLLLPSFEVNELKRNIGMRLDLFFPFQMTGTGNNDGATHHLQFLGHSRRWVFGAYRYISTTGIVNS